MASSIETLYRQVIMDHAKTPRNKGITKGDKFTFVHFKNPSCGDDINVEVKIENGIITDIHQDGRGCSISMSSASVMTETLIGKTKEEALELIEEFYTLVKGEEVTHEDELGEAIAFEGVSQFPARIKCATLSWKAIEQAIKDDQNE